MANKATGKRMGRPPGSKNKKKKAAKTARKTTPTKRLGQREPNPHGEVMDRDVKNPLFSVIDGPPPLARYTLTTEQQRQLTQLGEVLAKSEPNTKNIALHLPNLRTKIVAYLSNRYKRMAFKSAITKDKKDVIIWRTK